MTVKIGFIGCGRATRKLHLPALKQLPSAEITAIACKTPETASEVVKQFNVHKIHDDYRAVLDDPEIDAIAICVPTSVHQQIGVEALKTNKHVFLEKPLALTVDECDHLVEAARHSSGVAMVGHHLRWHRMIQNLSSRITSGVIGDIRLIRSTFTSNILSRSDPSSWRFQRSFGGGTLVESGVHHYDLWRFLTGANVLRVQAVSQHANIKGERADDTNATVTAQLDNGVLAVAAFCQSTSDSLDISVFGSKGVLRLSLYGIDGVTLSRVEDKGLKKITSLARSAPNRLGSAVKALRVGGFYKDAYVQQWSAFLRSITSNTDVVHSATFEDGRQAVRISAAAVQSADTGRAVDLEPADALSRAGNGIAR